MSKRSGFEHLKKDYPVFQIKNLTDVTKTLDLIGDNDVQIPGKTTVPIKSEDLYQMPDSSFFWVIEPNMRTLVKYGIIKGKDDAAEDDDSADDGKKKKANTSSSSSGSNSTSSSDTSKTVPGASSSVDAANTDGKSGSNTADK